MAIKTSDILTAIKPYVMRWISEFATSNDVITPGYAPSPHSLDSVHHTGSASRSQYPDAVLTDGTRELVGNLSVSTGVTIDGVDISVHAANANAHHSQVHGIISGDHTVTGSALDLIGLSASNTLGVLTPSSSPGAASAILKTTAAGLLTLKTFAINDRVQSSWSPNVTNTYSLGNSSYRWLQMYTNHLNVIDVTSDLIPGSTDTYDLGSSLKLWRKGWVSELDTIIFAEQTITLLGGWFVVGKNQGSLPSDITAVQTQIDFGMTMTTGHFVLFRGSLAVEYMQIVSAVSGTTYNVTRNLDGSGANAWIAGSPFLVLGTTGDGRIELNAYDTPRINLIRQGSTYNAQTEIIRIGDLNGNWNYSVEKWGIAIGEYASSKPNITVDTDGVLRIRRYTTDIIKLNTIGAYISGTLEMESGGIILGGSGNVRISNNGLEFLTGTGVGNAITWYDSTFGSSASFRIRGEIDGSNSQILFIDGLGLTQLKLYENDKNMIRALVVGSSTSAAIAVDGYLGTNRLIVGSVPAYTPASAKSFFSGDVHIGSGGGLAVGYATSADPNPGAGEIKYTGGLVSRPGSTDHSVYGFKPLENGVAWSGNANGLSTTAKTAITISTEFSGIPSEVKGLLIRVVVRDSGSAANDCYIILSPNNTAWSGLTVDCSGLANDAWERNTIIVPVVTANTIYYQLAASGSGTLDLILDVWGYFI